MYYKSGRDRRDPPLRRDMRHLSLTSPASLLLLSHPTLQPRSVGISTSTLISLAMQRITLAQMRRAIRPPATLASTYFFAQRRPVQFEQTSQTVGAVGNRKKQAAAVKWVTKSTKDYMKEGDTAATHAASSLLAEHRSGSRSLDERERATEIRDAAEARVEQELMRFKEEKGRRWSKGIGFFKRQGKSFMIVYTVAYVGTFLLLYLGFATDFLKKEAAFEYMFFFLGRYVDKDAFYARIEAWDDKINLGFAFVINEMLELVRFPLVMFLFYQLRPLFGRSHRGMRKSMFRMNAAES
eukprot:gene8445-5923_t